MTDQKYMKRAIRLAGKGAGWVNPNPMVGAVLVKNGTVIAEGYHEYFGGQHAEVNALNKITGSLRGTTLYTNLEPCIHHAKTPPCANLIVEKKIPKVIIAMADPNPLVNGKGIAYLKSNGVKVETGLLKEEAAKLNEIFCKFIVTRKPFCLYKGAMTLDGKIATITGDSRWISGEASRKTAHRLRHEFSAVMVGLGTVLKDNPRLDARQHRKISKDPWKVIVDSSGRIPPDAQVLTHNPGLAILAVTQRADSSKLGVLRRSGVQVIVCPEKNDQVDLQYLMLALGAMDIDSVLLEGGGTLAFSAMQENIIDKVLLFVAPRLLGGKKAPTFLEGEGIRRISEAIPVRKLQVRKIKEDLMIEGYL